MEAFKKIIGYIFIGAAGIALGCFYPMMFIVYAILIGVKLISK